MVMYNSILQRYTKTVNRPRQKKRKGVTQMQATEPKQATPFMKIGAASRATGLSQYYLRQGCKDGTIPHIKSGTVYLVNVSKLLRQLDAEGGVAE